MVLTNLESRTKYKEGNNRPSSVNQISPVHYHDKSGNKCYTQENYVNRCLGRVNIYLLRPRTRRGIRSTISHIRHGQIRRIQNTQTEDKVTYKETTVRHPSIKHHYSVHNPQSYQRRFILECKHTEHENTHILQL